MKAYIRKGCFSSYVLIFILLSYLAFAGGDVVYAFNADFYKPPLVAFLKKLLELLCYVVLVVSWGVGFYYFVEGIIDAASAEPHDVRERRKGINKIMGGIILIGLGVIVKMVYNYFFPDSGPL